MNIRRKIVVTATIPTTPQAYMEWSLLISPSGFLAGIAAITGLIKTSVKPPDAEKITVPITRPKYMLSGRIKGGKIKSSYSVIERLAKRKWIYNILTSKIMSFIVIAYGFVLCPIAFLQSANYDAIPNNFLDIQESLSACIVDKIWVISLIIFSIATTVPFIMRLFCPRLPEKLKMGGF